MVSADVSWRGRMNVWVGVWLFMCDNAVYSSASFGTTLSESKKLVINLKSKYKEESQPCTHLGSSLGESEAKISNIYREGASSPLPPPWGQSITVLNITTMTPPFTRGGHTYGTIQYRNILLFRIRIDYFRIRIRKEFQAFPEERNISLMFF